MKIEHSPVSRLDRKVAIVTGASRGIGEQLAHGFAAAGAKVVGCARSKDGAEKVAARIRAAGGEAIGVSGDMTKPADIQSVIDSTLAKFGRLDIMMANAGIDITKPAIDYKPEEFDQVMRGNLKSAFLCAQAAARQFIQQESGGAIVFTSSNASYAGFQDLTPYCGSKAGIDGLVRSLALEWGQHGIRVNAINPGYTNHQMNPASDEIMDQGREAILARTPLRRVGDVAEMAGPAVFLASDAASFVTGVCLLVDGGWCIS